MEGNSSRPFGYMLELPPKTPGGNLKVTDCKKQQKTAPSIHRKGALLIFCIWSEFTSEIPKISD